MFIYNRKQTDNYLSIAASLLEDFGRRSWPTLKKIAEDDSSISELFVESIAFCDGIPIEERMDVLSRFSKNPFVNVRRRVMDVLLDFDPVETVVPQIIQN